MSTSHERMTVMRALGLAERRALSASGYVEPFEVARATAEFVLRTATGGRVSFGERRTRRILGELVDDGLARRRRSWGIGHTFQLTDEGRREVS